MSHRKHKKLERPLNEIVSFRQPTRLRSTSERIMSWIINGDPDGAEAVHEVFPLPNGKEGVLITTTN